MKNFAKKIIALWLKICVKLFLLLHKCDIIAVTGTTNKDSVKQEISQLLSQQYKVRTSPRNFNSEIGIPLSILNLPVGYNSVLKWSIILIKALAKPFLSKDIPQIIVLELAIDTTKDMDYLLKLIEPKIAVITDISEQYLDTFENLDDLASEYLKVARAVTASGLVLLNADDPRLKNIKDIKAKLWYYGERTGSDFYAFDIRDEGYGIYFKLKNNNQITEIKVNKYGRHHLYARLAAEAVKKYYEEK